MKAESELEHGKQGVGVSGRKSLNFEHAYAAFDFRLSLKEWLVALFLLLGLILLLPWLGKKRERFEPEADFRVPYSLSKDYWLYDRWLDHQADRENVFLVGDSVVWGEYVSSKSTLSGFLNRMSEEDGSDSLFVNAGVNGLFPLALEGLIRNYGEGLTGQKVLLHLNLLWMSSPSADLSEEKESLFNHASLVPQFPGSIPSYRATLEDRLRVLVQHEVEVLRWFNHLKYRYFEGRSIYGWTLADDGRYPPTYPNSYKVPSSAFSIAKGRPIEIDPDRGVDSRRHRPWSTEGVGKQSFPWLSLDESLQWQAFQRLIATLKRRQNDVLILVGPFNEHFLTSSNKPEFRALRDEAVRQLSADFECVVFATLPSELYGDASHPLTKGYEQMAIELWQHRLFRRFVNQEDSANAKFRNGIGN